MRSCGKPTRRRFGELQPTDIRRLRQLEAENPKLKKLVAERDLEIERSTAESGELAGAPRTGRVRVRARPFEAAGIETSAPDTGCCGMASAFGFRPDTYATSVKIANLSLLPKVHRAPAEAFIVANGFSSREQIEGLARRQTLHLADVLAREIG